MHQTRQYKNDTIFSRLSLEAAPDFACPVFESLVSGHGEQKDSAKDGGVDFYPKGQTNHRRFYRVADITIQLDTDLPMTDATFHRKFRTFEVDNPGSDTIRIHHLFGQPDLNGLDLGQEVYRRPPWAIFRKEQSWIYLRISSSLPGKFIPGWLFRILSQLYFTYGNPQNKNIFQIAFFNDDHTRARIYSDRQAAFGNGGHHSLTLFPTDQILLARILAERQGCYLHSAGIILEGQGLLFAGHSGAGKSTLVRMLRNEGEILCDDRIIVRGYPHGFRIYGNWNHGEVTQISAGSAPLKAIFLLQKSHENRLVPVTDKRAVVKRLLGYLVKPLVTADWWDNMLSLVERIAREVPCYCLHFDKRGRVADLLKHLK